MKQIQATHTYWLDNGKFLHAYATDPNITKYDLKKFLTLKDRILNPSKENLEAVVKVPDAIFHKGTINNLKDVNIEVLDGTYHVPQALRSYRNNIEEDSLRKGNFNGQILMIDGEIQLPLKIRQGGYFDFKATQPTAIPSKLDSSYTQGKTINELMPELGLKMTDLGRYLGFSFIMMPDDGKEIHFVQRAKNLGIAADCMALSGGTPQFDQKLLSGKKDIAKYFSDFIAEEMEEEYKLTKKEFNIGAGYLMDDYIFSPCIAIEIFTKPDTAELSRRTFGNPQTIKEHPIVYASTMDSLKELTDRFPIVQSTEFYLTCSRDSK